MAPRSWSHEEYYTVVLIFRYIQYLHMMNSVVECLLVSSRTQVQPKIILNPYYLPDYLSVSYDYGLNLKRHN